MVASEPDFLLTCIKQLRHECGPLVFPVTLMTLERLLSNVLEHPAEEKYRTIRLGNALFHERVGRHAAGLAFLREIGFEDANLTASSSNSTSSSCTHLALPVADSERLSRALVLLVATGQAINLLDGKEAEEALASASDVMSSGTDLEGQTNSNGKRAMPDASSREGMDDDPKAKRPMSGTHGAELVGEDPKGKRPMSGTH
eukprot:gene30267-37807_t